LFDLYIANKNYSSWSLRPWVLMRMLDIPFAERLLRFGDRPAWDAFRRISAAGKVPCLVDAPLAVWDSLAIAEYLAERHPRVWPAAAEARAWARCAAAEMHSGFASLRECCSMNCGVRMRLHETPAALRRDIERLEGLWNDGLSRFGGPFVAGDAFSAADAFFAPVAFRIQTYGLGVESAAQSYAARLLDLAPMHAWYEDALRETFRDEAHEHEMGAMGRVIEDLRAR
jgi:glutathione S-transferase